jgi:hypothetical protein
MSIGSANRRIVPDRLFFAARRFLNASYLSSGHGLLRATRAGQPFRRLPIEQEEFRNRRPPLGALAYRARAHWRIERRTPAQGQWKHHVLAPSIGRLEVGK